jgi:hypothetical protein
LKLSDTQAAIPQKVDGRELGGFPLLIIDTLLTEPTDLAFLQLVQHFARLSCRQNMEREDATVVANSHEIFFSPVTNT